MKQRILATLLSLCLLVGLMPTAALAAEGLQLITIEGGDTATNTTTVSDVVVEKDTVMVGSFDELKKTIEETAEGETRSIVITNGFEFEEKIQIIGKNICIFGLDEVCITAGTGVTPLLEVKQGELKLENITFDGNNKTAQILQGYEGSIITLNNGAILTNGSRMSFNKGTLIMNDGSEISNHSGAQGGAINLWEQGTFIMNGGVIRNNSATYNGGAIDANSGATVIINDGIIEKNRNNGNNVGGAIAVRAGSTLEIHGGIFTENESTFGDVIGVSGTGNNKVSMDGGKIYGNTARNDKVSSGTYVGDISGGEIYGNIGGVEVSSLSGNPLITSNYIDSEETIKAGIYGVVKDGAIKYSMTISGPITSKEYIDVAKNSTPENNIYFVGTDTYTIQASDLSKLIPTTDVDGKSTILYLTGNNSIAGVPAYYNGGSFSESTVFEVGQLGVPKKDGSIFDGWYEQKDFSSSPVTTAQAGKTYYAKWAESDYEISDTSLNFASVSYGSAVDAQTITVTGTGGSGTLTAESSDEGIFTATASGSEVTVAPKVNLDVGTYSEVITITTPDNATFSVPVTITIAKAEPSLTITPSVPSLTGGGTVTLTVDKTGLPDGAAVSVTGNNGANVIESNGTYTANLPNTTATYTFTASYEGDTNHEATSDTCTVSVTQYTSPGGGSSSGSSSSSNVSGSGDDVIISASGGTVTDAQMESAVKKADKGSTITIKATSSTTVTLPVGGMEDAADNDNDVLLDLRYGEVTLSARAIAGMTDGVSSNDKIKVSVANQTSSKDETISDLLDKGAAVFDVTVEVDGVEIHSFDGTLTITLTVSNLSKISDPHVLHILNNGTKEYYTPDRISGNTITVTGIRNLSTFAVIPGSEVPQTNPFTDVSTSDYYYDAVLWAADNGVTGGTSATTFSPNVTVTRAQMVTFLWRAHGSPKATGANPFTDVSTSDYYYDAVLWAVANGVTSGTSADTFGPDAAVTRAQAVTFQWRAAGSPVVSGSSFDDVAADAYYANAVAWAVANGITSGTGGSNFSPDVVVTRAQAVTFLWKELA